MELISQITNSVKYLLQNNIINYNHEILNKFQDLMENKENIEPNKFIGCLQELNLQVNSFLIYFETTSVN